MGTEVTYDGRCFGCGPLNAEGMRMSFADRGGEAVAEFTVPERYQSWAGVVHGGVVALMLDEAVGWAAWNSGRPGVTGRLEVKYRQPLRVGEEVLVRGRVESTRRSLVYAVASIERSAGGDVIAEATATLMDVPAVITLPRD